MHLPDSRSRSWMGCDSLKRWQSERAGRRPIDVVLLTHPRDEEDLQRMFPWAASLSRGERRALLGVLRPMFGEIIETPSFVAGILFLPALAEEIITPGTRQQCRQMVIDEAMPMLADAGARIVCLGGLTGSLTRYGQRLLPQAERLNLSITTGHAATANCVLQTYLRACGDMGLDPSTRQMALLGVGSVGAAFARLLVRQPVQPASLVLVDVPGREEHVAGVAAELAAWTDLPISIELTSHRGQLLPGTACYKAGFLISAVSTPYVIDINKVAPGTVLVDDSQPYCWSRSEAWQRVQERGDIVPCEAGLVDCTALGFRSRFPFDFAGSDHLGSPVAWSCLSEGLLRSVDPTLQATLGEPAVEQLMCFGEAFTRSGLSVAPLQCGPHVLPIDTLRTTRRDEQCYV